MSEARHRRARLLADLNRTPCPLCARPARNPGRYGGSGRAARLWWDGWRLCCRWGHEFDDPALVAALQTEAKGKTVLL